MYITETEVAPRVPEVLLDGHSTYTIELEAEVLGAKVPVSPSHTAGKVPTWRVAAVDAEGVVTPVADGTCTMTGRDGNSEVSLTAKGGIAGRQHRAVETDHSAWDFKKNPLHRPSKPLLSKTASPWTAKWAAVPAAAHTPDRQETMPSRPDAVRIRIASALAMPTQLSLSPSQRQTAPRATSWHIRNCPPPLPQNGLCACPMFDTNDAAIYPLEFVSLTISLGDAAKSTGKLEIPGIEMVYDNKGQTGVDNIVVENPADAPAEYFTSKVSAWKAMPSPRVYILYVAETLPQRFWLNNRLFILL